MKFWINLLHDKFTFFQNNSFYHVAIEFTGKWICDFEENYVVANKTSFTLTLSQGLGKWEFPTSFAESLLHFVLNEVHVSLETVFVKGSITVV